MRIGELRTFEELLAKHGRGSGCDICKPTVASILASCWNEFVLGRDQAPLQDSNDYYLANIQKDGTYSVVPRMPAARSRRGSSSPSARSPRNTGLYTKITGGQRIDLFGAQVHQLPLIWRELIDAGFESGHAYGKAMRTVKSCVGSTWCRYGVQDSVGLAIDLEHRYKGLRVTAQDQVRRVRLHPRVRRGAEQGRRRHRHREGLEPLRLRQRRHEAAPCRTAGGGSRPRTR